MRWHAILDARTTLLTALLAAIAVGIASLASPARADDSTAYASTAPGSQEQWQFSLTPYLWAPTIKGQLNFSVPTGGGGGGGGVPAGVPVGVTVIPSQYLPKLASAFMVAGETHNPHWGLATDLIYLNLGISNAQVTNVSGPGGIVTIPINTNMQVRFTSTLWTLDATFNVMQTPHWNLQGLAGGRYLYAPIRVDWSLAGPLGLLNATGTHTQSASVWDGIVGAKGRVDLGDGHWFVPYYADVGTGEAHLTWQAIGGFGYAAKHGQSIQLVYRNLFYDMGSNGVLHNINLGGAALGYNFKL